MLMFLTALNNNLTHHCNDSLACSNVLPQKMLQSPYFFFDVVCLHNGVEEQGDETSWRVRKVIYFSTSDCLRPEECEGIL